MTGDLNVKSEEYDANEYLKKYDDDFEEFAEVLLFYVRFHLLVIRN